MKHTTSGSRKAPTPLKASATERRQRRYVVGGALSFFLIVFGVSAYIGTTDAGAIDIEATTESRAEIERQETGDNDSVTIPKEKKAPVMRAGAARVSGGAARAAAEKKSAPAPAPTSTSSAATTSTTTASSTDEVATETTPSCELSVPEESKMILIETTWSETDETCLALTRTPERASSDWALEYGGEDFIEGETFTLSQVDDGEWTTVTSRSFTFLDAVEYELDPNKRERWERAFRSSIEDSWPVTTTPDARE